MQSAELVRCGAIESASRGDEVSITHGFVICAVRDGEHKTVRLKWKLSQIHL